MHWTTAHESGAGCQVKARSVSGATSASASDDNCSNCTRKRLISGASASGPEAGIGRDVSRGRACSAVLINAELDKSSVDRYLQGADAPIRLVLHHPNYGDPAASGTASKGYLCSEASFHEPVCSGSEQACSSSCSRSQRFSYCAPARPRLRPSPSLNFSATSRQAVSSGWSSRPTGSPSSAATERLCTPWRRRDTWRPTRPL